MKNKICFLLISILVSTLIYPNFSQIYAQEMELTSDQIIELELEKKQLELQKESENFQWVLAILTIASGSFTALWGYLKYNRDQFVKKQAVFLELVKEYDNSKKMYIAKRILDGFEFTFDEDKEKFVNQDGGKLSKENMSLILEDKKSRKTPLSEGEIKIRESFDDLYNFFYKLYYLEKTKMLSQDEMDYFKYFIRQASKIKACMEYVKYSSEWVTMFKHFAELGYCRESNVT